ncbi:hypothetical protein [Yoonia sediminilitoris]|uniref:Uncharacterized protein n=1 Tax=Yoonia sediminilitoris TaxID=1286148 RepID=A0A2T6KPQ5_9RHOB|nr:hypothetical protein [Yoonia sediminilitoris]PUB18532.1 hypothetical protein C8N45_101116 [Yoonia sediminilitoris]RCW98700.1 hypothetical protein DFP92_101116 [Yoonia sediminilitoris]
MAQANVPFDKRLKRIVRRHDRMARGVVKTVNADGLIVASPRVYTPRFPLKGLAVLIVMGFLFKGFLFAYMGADAYNERVAALHAGSIMEQAGGWIMHADPATVMIAEGLEVVIP